MQRTFKINTAVYIGDFFLIFKKISESPYIGIVRLNGVYLRIEDVKLSEKPLFRTHVDLYNKKDIANYKYYIGDKKDYKSYWYNKKMINLE